MSRPMDRSRSCRIAASSSGTGWSARLSRTLRRGQHDLPRVFLAVLGHFEPQSGRDDAPRAQPSRSSSSQKNLRRTSGDACGLLPQACSSFAADGAPSVPSNPAWSGRARFPGCRCGRPGSVGKQDHPRARAIGHAIAGSGRLKFMRPGSTRSDLVAFLLPGLLVR